MGNVKEIFWKFIKLINDWPVFSLLPPWPRPARRQRASSRAGRHCRPRWGNTYCWRSGSSLGSKVWNRKWLVHGCDRHIVRSHLFPETSLVPFLTKNLHWGPNVIIWYSLLVHNHLTLFRWQVGSHHFNNSFTFSYSAYGTPPSRPAVTPWLVQRRNATCARWARSEGVPW